MFKQDDSVSVLYGISAQRAKLFENLDIYTIDDLVRHYPRGYENRGDVKKVCELIPGDLASCILEISSPVKSTRISSKSGRPMTVQKVLAHDETGSVTITFFNQDFLKNTLYIGKKFRFYGNVSGTILSPQMLSPSYEPALSNVALDNLVPIYPLTNGITGKMLSKLIKQILPTYQNYENLPKEILEEYKLCSLYEALQNIHFPKTKSDMENSRKRLAFEELLDFQLKLRMLRNRNQKGKSPYFSYTEISPFLNSLSYSLTNSQKNAVNDIISDFSKKTSQSKHIPPMRRLIQGDVGCGKTVVAAAAVYLCVKNGYQASLMVPTEILAEQHFQSLLPLMKEHGITTALLTGSTKATEKKKILSELFDGKIDFVIGTHALIEDNVIFKNHGLAITDEQHRFGVRQREKLSSKNHFDIDGEKILPHMLVMSATPIPRTLAMILYGDLDLTIIDEMPPQRQKVDTFAVGESMRQRIYAFTEKLVNEGRQAYIVCPLAQNEDELSEEIYESNLKSAAEYCKKLQNEVFPHLRLAFVHGKMKSSEKDKIMKSFSNHEIDILVSTTVIEVGVNVPNAALMIVENAERFGLSQLHQLRGRVGRGKHKSYCVLMSPIIKGQIANKTNTAEKRFKIMCENDSGFKISEYDLELRGPGDFFGRRQHGELVFKIADLAVDMLLVEQTKKLADKITKNK